MSYYSLKNKRGTPKAMQSQPQIRSSRIQPQIQPQIRPSVKIQPQIRPSVKVQPLIQPEIIKPNKLLKNHKKTNYN